jgi:hypothetical protein
MAPKEADATPLPKEETTPPVMNIYRVIEYESLRKLSENLLGL